MTEPQRSTDDRELELFVHRWAAAIVSNDVARMSAFVTDDWVLIDGPGTISRDAFHAAVAQGALAHTSMTHEVLEIRHLAPEVAVIRTRGRNTAVFRGRRITADEWTTDIVTRTDEGWRCVLTQLTPREVPAP